jgi:hypothetical protein
MIGKTLFWSVTMYGGKDATGDREPTQRAVDRLRQEWTVQLHRAIRGAARNRLRCRVHKGLPEKTRSECPNVSNHGGVGLYGARVNWTISA